MKKHLALLLLLAITLAYSCKKETEDSIDMGFDYFPTEVGAYHIYSVDSIVFDDYNNRIDTFSFKVKMEFISTFTDNANNEAYRWRKSSKTDTTDWAFCSNNTITKSKSNIETVVENVRFVNLIFPVVAGNTWDANAKNSESKIASIFSDVDFDETILGKTYQNCALASYEDEVNLIQEFVHYEIYAKNIGLVKRKRIHKELKTSGTSGYNVEYLLLEYGKQ